MTKKLVFSLITFGLILGIFEAIGYLIFYIEDDIYDHRKTVLEEIEAYSLADLQQIGADPVLGWKTQGPKVFKDCNCQGSSVEYSFDRFGARIYRDYDRAAVDIIVVGDSYSHGHEVAAHEAFSGQLAEILGCSVANHAVNGYGPVQAFLNIQEIIHHYPKARIVILGIMYENIFRMVNSYRPALTEKSPVYQIKPYMRHGEIEPHPGQNVFMNIDTLKKYANDAFENDFWAKPQHKFPYSVSFVRALGSNFFYFKKFPRKLRKIGFSEYFLAYSSENFSTELRSLFDDYATFAVEKKVIPAVIFIPRDKYDTHSVSRFIEANHERFHGELLIGDVGTANMDWDKYNMLNTQDANNIKVCHPSPYGHRKIAEYIADLLRREHAWPSMAERQSLP